VGGTDRTRYGSFPLPKAPFSALREGARSPAAAARPLASVRRLDAPRPGQVNLPGPAGGLPVQCHLQRPTGWTGRPTSDDEMKPRAGATVSNQTVLPLTRAPLV
jgi:hypothetical protein